ncbi:signal peptidase I [Erysipelotrichaceae bacterium HCN-30851]
MDSRNDDVKAVIDEVDVENRSDKKKQGIKYELLDLLKTFIICFIAVFLLTTFVVKPVRVDGRSMYPTLEDGEVGLMNVFSAKFTDIDRFDVVVAYNEESGENWVKRVIGLPGDTVYAKDDVVYVNGLPIEEPYLDTDYVNQIRERGDYFTQDFDKITLGEDEYFLMGDNRVVSYDSRRVGPFKRDDIKGKGIFILYPFDKIKMIGN